MINATQRIIVCTAIFFTVFTASLLAAESAAKLDSLPALTGEMAAPVKSDWLIQSTGRKTGVYRSGPKEIAMVNGLVRRSWRIAPNGATVGFDNLMTGAAVIRGVKPEAVLEFDGVKYSVG